MPTLLMPKATAVWLVDNTTLTFDQIAEFCSLHRLEAQGIASGDVALGIQGLAPGVNTPPTQRPRRRSISSTARPAGKSATTADCFVRNASHMRTAVPMARRLVSQKRSP